MSSSTVTPNHFDAGPAQGTAKAPAHTATGAPVEPVPQVIILYRVVVMFILASLFWKSTFYPSIYHIYTSYQLQDGFFPPILTNTYVLAALMLIPIIIGMLAMLIRNQAYLIFQATVTAAFMFGMCIHQGSYNDVTFLTCFWVSLWCVWYAIKLKTPEKELIPRAKVFGILILSLVFFGGAVGKWTPGYWSGQVLYEIYFVDRDFWFFNLLRAAYDAETLRSIATFYSRMVVIAESSCALLWLLPPKIAGGIGLAMLMGIVLFSNVQLFSVMFCLIGLTLIALHEPKPANANLFQTA